jgi:hypothetical protein
LRKGGFSKSATAKIIATVLRKEGRPPESVFDFVHGITALRIKISGSSLGPRRGGCWNPLPD